MRGFIGEFEELVLLTIACLGKKAYGVAIKEDIEQRAKRPISIGSLHSTITRLQEKGFLESRLGEPSHKRGGRRKRFFSLTNSGVLALNNIKNLRDDLWVEARLNPTVDL
jgi:DNA-binding PadR family transcriptional regulator